MADLSISSCVSPHLAPFGPARYPNRMAGHLLSFGHGYSAQALTPLLLNTGWTVTGTTRTEEKAKRLAQTGITPMLWSDDALAEAIGRATHVMISVSPQNGVDPILHRFEREIAAAAPKFEWVGYLSTIGVYGDHQGGWVDETTPPNPATQRGKDRVRAEAHWSDFAKTAGFPLHIFRIAGIYGPGRGPFEKVQQGKARRIIKKGQVFSRIHVEDIARVLEASIASPNAGRIYNLCDDDPAPPQDVLSYAAKLLGVPDPPAIPFEEADMTPMARSFYAESKRVRNDRIKDELGVKLKYPNYRVGLQSLLDAL